MRNLERLSGSDQDSVDQEMYIDLDDASVDSLTGKRGRHHVGAEVINGVPPALAVYLTCIPKRAHVPPCIFMFLL